MHLIAGIMWFLTPANWPVILAVAVGLGFVIFVHELGHFLVAKACGVKCEKFYIGFDVYGLKILKFQWGETEYGIGAFPLGGYVKMLGQDDNPARIAEEGRRSRAATADSSIAAAEHVPVITHGDLPPEPVSDPHEPYDPRSYMAQSVPKRMAIISAGVIMNVIFAFIMAAVAYKLGVKETPCIVRAVVAGGAAWQANLQPGDIVKQIGDVKDPRFRDLQTGVTLGNLAQGIDFVIERPGQTEPIKLTLHPDTSQGAPMIGVAGPADEPVLASEEATIKHSPAGRASPKFEPRDVVGEVDGVGTPAYPDIERQFVLHRDQPLVIGVLRHPQIGSKSETGASPDQHLNVEVSPTPMRDFGMAMTISPIEAIQEDSPAVDAGLKVGDRLISLNGQPLPDPLILSEAARRAAVAGEKVQLEIERKSGASDADIQKIKIDLTPRVPQSEPFSNTLGAYAVPALGVALKVTPKVVTVGPDSAAARADIRAGDELLAVQILPSEKQADEKPDEDPGKLEFGKDVSWPMLIHLLPFLNPERKVRFWIQNGESEKQSEKQVDLVPTETRYKDAPVHDVQRGFIFEPISKLRVAANFGEAIRLGARETVEDLLLVYRFLQKITQTQISPKLLGGPVEIARQAGLSVQQGLSTFLLFLTVLSANLAVVNFLPIPVLDGGHMVFLLYEGIRGKPASERVIIGFTYIGLALILSLMMFVLALDLHIISRH